MYVASPLCDICVDLHRCESEPLEDAEGAESDQEKEQRVGLVDSP